MLYVWGCKKQWNSQHEIVVRRMRLTCCTLTSLSIFHRRASSTDFSFSDFWRLTRARSSLDFSCTHPTSQLFIVKIYTLTVSHHFIGQVKGQQQTSRSRSRCSLSQLPSATLRASRNTSIWCRRRTICSSPAILHSPYNWLLNSRSRFNFCICHTTQQLVII